MEIAILIVLAGELRTQIKARLEPLALSAYFAESMMDLNELLREGKAFQVAVVPATLSQISWWELCSILASFKVKPELLIYSPAVDFQLWAGVLDAGGFDVITEAISSEQLRIAILGAVETFKSRNARHRD